MHGETIFARTLKKIPSILSYIHVAEDVEYVVDVEFPVACFMFRCYLQMYFDVNFIYVRLVLILCKTTIR